MDDQTVSEKKHFVILMVDDDESNRMLVEQAFGEESNSFGFEIDLRCLADGAKLLECMDHCKGSEDPKGPVPNFILLNLNMPVAGGRETVRRLISHPISRRIPLIVFATSGKQSVMECYWCGGSAFRQLPHDPKTFRQMVRIIVNHWLCSTQLPTSARFECMGYG